MVYLVTSYLLGKKSCQGMFEIKMPFGRIVFCSGFCLLLVKYDEIYNSDDCVGKMTKFRYRIDNFFVHLAILSLSKIRISLIETHLIA